MPSRELSERGAETRALILDTARDAFAELGFRATSVREIASRCGLTHPALIYHFPTKADLLMAVLTRRDEGAGVDFDALDARTMLAHLVETARLNAEQRGVVELFATLSVEAASPSHPAHAFFRRRYANLVAAVARAFGDLRDEGATRPDLDPRGAAIAVIALMDGLQVQWLLDPQVDMAAALTAHLATQVEGPLAP